MYDRIERYSRLTFLKYATANLKVINSKKAWKIQTLDLDDLLSAERYVIKITQAHNFSKELNSLHANRPIVKSSNILILNPFLDKDGVTRIGGRATKSATLNEAEKHPVLIPKDSALAKLIELDLHQRRYYVGRYHTQAVLR